MPNTAAFNPVPCLAAHLVDVGPLKPNEWSGAFPLTKAIVYVDGPFKTVAMASASAASLNGVELEASGGLFTVEAALTSRLGTTVNTIASCLAKTTSATPPATGALSY
ncbi:MAG: hypothetical protein ACLP01_27710 [Solirubrobacteraceae bacterium]